MIDVFLVVSKNAIFASPAKISFDVPVPFFWEPTGSAWIAEVWRKFVADSPHSFPSALLGLF